MAADAKAEAELDQAMRKMRANSVNDDLGQEVTVSCNMSDGCFINEQAAPVASRTTSAQCYGEQHSSGHNETKRENQIKLEPSA